MWYLVAIIIIFFIIQYYFIISLEEETLKLKFGEEYESYIENVPKLLPKLTPWDSGNKIEPQNLYKTLKTEKRTLQNILLILILILLASFISKANIALEINRWTTLT